MAPLPKSAPFSTLATLLGIWRYVLHQPKGSIGVSIQRSFGWTGVPNPKGLQLVLNPPFKLKLFTLLSWIKGHREIDSIDEHTVPEKLEDKQMVVRYTNGKGEARCHGGSDLKGSQAYPRQFLSFRVFSWWIIKKSGHPGRDIPI